MNFSLLLRRLMPSLAFLAGLALVAGAQQASPAGRSHVVCYTSYDSDYFYFAAVVTKPELAGAQSSIFSRPKEDDSIAVYLQGGSGAPGPKRTAKSVEMAASVAGGVQLYRGANATPLTKYEDFLRTPGLQGRPVPFKFAVKLKGKLNGPASQANGYSVEMAIPWVEIGEPPAAGQRLRFNVVAYSASPSTPHILSLAPGVKTEADVQNPSLWDEIVFVDAPVRSVASAPEAKVSARLYTSKPLIDGEIEEGTWSSLTAFGFAEAAGGGAEAVSPAAGLSRFRPKVNLKPARPPIRPLGPGASTGAGSNSPAAAPDPHSAQPLPRLVFALYQYDYQNDARKQAPYRPVRTPDGATKLSEHPLSGPGPWMTYDRVDWHRGQLEEARRAGIDVILPIYRASAADKQRYSVRGLMTLTACLKQMHAAKQDYPLVGLFLETSSLTDELGDKLNLTTPGGKARFYAALKEFFLLVPARFRASLPLDARNGGGNACVVVLSSAAAFEGLDGSFVPYARARFRREFGSDLLFLGGPDFKGKADLDGYVSQTHGKGFEMDDSGWIKPAAVGPGFDPLSPPDGKAVRRRLEGETYRKDWKQALSRQPTWVFIDGWNDFEEGAEIAPTFQHGIEYVDLTRVFAHAFRSGGTALRASYLSENVPPVAPAGGVTNVNIRVANTGAGVWSADAYMLAYLWKKEGAGSPGPPTLVKLPDNLASAQAATVPVALNLPAEPGNYTLVVDVAQIGKKGDVTALLSGLGSQKLELPVHIVRAEDAALPRYALTVLSNDLTTTAETGGSYAARLTLRNDGAEAWKKGGKGRILARVWRYTSPINGTGERESLEPVTMADAGVDLPIDVPPGGIVSVTVPVTFSTAEENPLVAWSQADNWFYQLRWEYSADEKGAAGAVSSPEPLALVDADFGVQFSAEIAPAQLPGEKKQPIRLGIRNVGPQTWARGAARVGYHWYYLDGTEAVWQDETTPLPQEIEPGGEVTDMLAWVAAPPYDGTYWLVWDVKIGETWTSTLPSVRSSETLVRRVEVVNGRLRLVNLDKSYNLDGVTGDASRGDGAFDGAGRSLPAELIPPFATLEEAPAAMWLPTTGTGFDSPRKISFRWGPKGEKSKNLIQCVGQKVLLGEKKELHPVTAVHLLAASSKPGVIGSFILLFEDGTEQLSSFPVSRWDAAPSHGEEVAYYCRYSRTRAGDDPDKPVGLFHYTVKVTEKKKLVAIQMPNAPDIKVAAITLER